MGVGGGPTVADPTNVAFSFDMYNSKSNKGKATTNVILNQNLYSSWAKGYTENNRWNRILPPVGVVAPVVGLRNDDTGGGGYWYSYGDYAPQADSTQYSVSIYVRTNDTTGVYIRFYTADNSESDRVNGAWKYFNHLGETDSSYNLLTGANENLADRRGWIRLKWNGAFTTDSSCDSDSLSFRYASLQGSPTYKRLWLCAPQLEANDVCTPFIPNDEFSLVKVPRSRDNVGHRILPCNASGEPTNGFNSATSRGNALHNLKNSTATDTENVTFLSDGTITFASGNNFQTGDISYPSSFADPFSVECWIYYDSSDTWTNAYRGRLVLRGGYAGSHGLVRNHTASGRVGMWVRSGGSTREAKADLTDGAWNHVVGTWTNNSLLAIYKNGALVDSNSSPGDLTGNSPDTGTWIVGGSGAASGASGTNYIGKIAKVQIYKSALTANQVKQNFAAHRQRYGV